MTVVGNYSGIPTNSDFVDWNWTLPDPSDSIAARSAGFQVLVIVALSFLIVAGTLLNLVTIVTQRQTRLTALRVNVLALNLAFSDLLRSTVSAPLLLLPLFAPLPLPLRFYFRSPFCSCTLAHRAAPTLALNRLRFVLLTHALRSAYTTALLLLSLSALLLYFRLQLRFYSRSAATLALNRLRSAFTFALCSAPVRPFTAALLLPL